MQGIDVAEINEIKGDIFPTFDPKTTNLCEATDMLLAEEQRAHTAERRVARLEHEAELAAARLQRCEAARLEVEVDLARGRASGKAGCLSDFCG